MNCRDIKKLLAAYVEEMVSPEENHLIENHLSSCQGCRRDVEELKRALALVRDLAPVESPPWFTQKIMSRIRSEQESKKTILQRLFYPLHIKVPLEAFATVLIAVAAVYLLRGNEVEMKRTYLPAPTEQTVSHNETAKQPAESEGDTAMSADQAAPGVPPESQKQTVATRDKSQQTSSPTVTGAPSPSVLPAKKEVAEKPSEVSEPSPQQVQTSQPPSASVKPDQETESTLRAARKGGRADQTALPARVQVGTLSEKKPVTREVILQVRDAGTAKPEVENLLQQLGAQNIKIDSLQGTEILIVELRTDKVQELIEKLKLIGEVNEKDASSGHPQGTIRIRIDIISLP